MDGIPKKKDDPKRPRTLHVSKSFTRMDPPHASPSSRSRASTIQSGTIPEAVPKGLFLSPESERYADGDIFSSKADEGALEISTPDIKVPETFDELPVEIRSLAERFLESLSAKVHPQPLTIDALSSMFQEFYIKADTQISTHIAILSSRISRSQTHPPPGKTPPGKRGSNASGKSSPSEGQEQQMLTASEITDKKKARRLLEVKRLALEEAVERGVCEKVYDKIWRHKSTDDEERDEKLRSRTAALSLVGIGLKELHVAENAKPKDGETAAEREEEVRGLLEGARDSLQKMDEERYPLGKLAHLKAAHKSIVETLSQLFPSSSSADEILPTLIYTLITSPPEGINVISNLNFIQRFRAANKIDGEAAYCLVNLEAAISFLETVDLSSLRSDELPEGPAKTTSRPGTPQSEHTPNPTKLAVTPASTSKSAVSPISATTSDLSPGDAKPLPSPSMPKPSPHPRRLSHLIQTQTMRLEEAGNAVRTSADEALNSINSTLENSFNFFFGRLREQQAGSPLASDTPLVLPRTLEDARKLVSTPPPEDDAASVSVASSVAGDHAEDHDEHPLKPEAKMLDFIGGKRPPRDRSVDSTRSHGSTTSKRVAFKDKDPLSQPTIPAAIAGTTAAPLPGASAHPGNVAVESMRNLGNTLNPLGRLSGGMNMIRGFGRTTSSASIGSVNAPLVEKPKVEETKNTLGPLEELKKVPPPIKRFMEAKDARDLRISDVDELLADYQRLALALRNTINS